MSSTQSTSSPGSPTEGYNVCYVWANDRSLGVDKDRLQPFKVVPHLNITEIEISTVKLVKICPTFEY